VFFGDGKPTAFPQSIVLRGRITPPFAERREIFLVDAIDLGLYLGMPALGVHQRGCGRLRRRLADKPAASLHSPPQKKPAAPCYLGNSERIERW